MTFDLTGLVVFLLAIVPGFIAQQSLDSIVPRSLRQKSGLEETGDYVLNSLIVHSICLMILGAYVSWLDPSTAKEFSQAAAQKKIVEWVYGHRKFVSVYFIS